MSPADRIFIGVWNRLTSDWSRLTTFRQMGVLGEDAARDALYRQNTYFVQQRLLNGELRKLLRDPDSFVKDGLAERMPLEMTEAAAKDFRRTLHASTLVFAHSILDAALYDCVRICAIAAPDDWSDIVRNRKVALAEVATKSYADLLRDHIEAELDRLERESLLNKVDRIFQICRPTKTEYLTNGFRFDRDRLEELDKLRHEVVHVADGDWSMDTIYDDLEFMRRSGLHVFVLVGERFDLCFSGKEAFEALAARRRSAEKQ